MPETFPRRYNEQFNRPREKQPIKQPISSNKSPSRYLEYRNRENLIKDKMDNPEKYISPPPKIEIMPEPSPMIFDSPPEKKSWFSKIFKKD